jgi:hypothetical protein
VYLNSCKSFLKKGGCKKTNNKIKIDPDIGNRLFFIRYLAAY